MDRRRNRLGGSLWKATERGAGAAELSGVARGGERQGSDTTKRGDRRPNDPGALSGNAAHHGTVCAHAGSEHWDCHLRVGLADVAVALERRRVASTLG